MTGGRRRIGAVLVAFGAVAVSVASPPALACLGFLDNNPCTLVAQGKCFFTAPPGHVYDIVSTGPYVAKIRTEEGMVAIRHRGYSPVRERRVIHPGDVVQVELQGPGTVAVEGWATESGL